MIGILYVISCITNVTIGYQGIAHKCGEEFPYQMARLADSNKNSKLYQKYFKEFNDYLLINESILKKCYDSDFILLIREAIKENGINHEIFNAIKKLSTEYIDEHELSLRRLDSKYDHLCVFSDMFFLILVDINAKSKSLEEIKKPLILYKSVLSSFGIFEEYDNEAFMRLLTHIIDAKNFESIDKDTTEKMVDILTRIIQSEQESADRRFNEIETKLEL